MAYLLREKFTNDSNFFVREVGRGSGVLERSLEITERCEGEEGDDEDRKPVCTYFGKRFGKIYLVTVKPYHCSNTLHYITLH